MPRQKPEFYETFLVVEGHGTFPLDMLRYANATPARETDSNAIDEDTAVRTRRRVLLRRYSRDDVVFVNPIYTNAIIERFKSFGWVLAGHFRNSEYDRAMARADEKVTP